MRSTHEIVTLLGVVGLDDIELRLDAIQKIRELDDIVQRLLNRVAAPHFDTWLKEVTTSIRQYAELFSLLDDSSNKQELELAYDGIVEYLKRMETLQTSYDTLRMMLDIYDDNAQQAKSTAHAAIADRDNWKRLYAEQCHRIEVLENKPGIPVQRLEAYRLLEVKDRKIHSLELIIEFYRKAAEQLISVKINSSKL